AGAVTSAEALARKRRRSTPCRLVVIATPFCPPLTASLSPCLHAAGKIRGTREPPLRPGSVPDANPGRHACGAKGAKARATGPTAPRVSHWQQCWRDHRHAWQLPGLGAAPIG